MTGKERAELRKQANTLTASVSLPAAHKLCFGLPARSFPL